VAERAVDMIVIAGGIDQHHQEDSEAAEGVEGVEASGEHLGTY